MPSRRTGTAPPAAASAVSCLAASVLGGGGVPGLGCLGQGGIAPPEVRSAMVGFEIVGEHRAVAQFENVRFSAAAADDGADTVASCVLRARAEDFTVVGEKVVTVSAREVGGSTRLEVSLRTERRATSVERVGCTTPHQARPR